MCQNQQSLQADDENDNDENENENENQPLVAQSTNSNDDNDTEKKFHSPFEELELFARLLALEQKAEADQADGTSSSSQTASADQRHGHQNENGSPGLDALFGKSFVQKMKLMNEANEFYYKQQYPDAEQRSLELLEVAQHTDDASSQAMALQIAGDSQISQRKYSEWLKSYKQMIKPPRDPEHEMALQRMAFSSLAVAHHGLGQYEEAIQYLQKEIAIIKELIDKPGQGAAYSNLGAAYSNLGIVHHDSGKYKNATDCHKKHLAIAKKLIDKAGQGRAYANLGIAHHALGKYEEAIGYHQEELKIARELIEKPGQSRAYGNLANALDGSGKYNEAIKYHQSYLDIAEQRDDKFGQGKAYANLGNTYRLLGDYKTAMKYCIKELDIAMDQWDAPRQGKAYGNLGNVYDDLGNYSTALEYHQRHLDISMHHESVIGQCKAFGDIANNLDGSEQYEKAISYHKKHVEFAEQLDDKHGLSKAYNNYGRALAGLCRYEDAITYYDKCLNVLMQLDDKPELGNVYGNLEVAYRKLGVDKSADECHQKHVQIAEQLQSTLGQGNTSSYLGNTRRRLIQHDTAIEYHLIELRIAQELEDKLGQSIAYGNLGLANLRSGNVGMACEHFASSNALVRELEAQLVEGQWRRYLLNFGEAHARLMDVWVVSAARSGDMIEALRVEEMRRCKSELAYQADDRIRGAISADVRRDDLRTMAQSTGASFLVVMKAYDNTLLTWVLSGKTGDLVYKQCRDGAYEGEELAEWVEDVTFAKWERWLALLCRARRYIQWGEVQGGDISTDLVTRLIEGLMPEHMKGDLDENLWASIRDPNTFLKTCAGWMGVFQELRDHFFRKGDDAMEQLNRLLWKPIVDNCPAVREVLESDSGCSRPIYFMPDPLLSPVPFAALKVGKRFLIEVAPVAQASSLRTLDCAQARWYTICNEPRQPSEALIVSYMDSIDEAFSLMEYCEELYEILPGEVISDSDATKEKVIEKITNGTASLVHFLVDGFKIDRDKTWAGVCLANNEYLSAYELHEWFTEENTSVNSSLTRLLVLCACSSGRGHRAREGVQGFARAALAGGIPCLLASKWNVSAKESIILMTRVYAFMAMNKEKYQTVAEALQTAVLSVLEDEQMRYKDSFYYWAAFISHGFASVQLDDMLLDQIHSRIESMRAGISIL